MRKALTRQIGARRYSVLLVPGALIAILVSGCGGATKPVTASASPSPPSNTSKPIISGTAQQGNTLRATNGSWSNSPTSYSYQWQGCNRGTCQNISGATDSSYTLQASHIGNTVDVVVTATNSAGRASATSGQTATVSAPTTSSRRIQHIVVVMLENTGYNQIIGNSAAPYINNTILSGSGLNAGLATNYHAGGGPCQHPSQPNYMEITSGNQSASGCGDSQNVARDSTNNIFHQLPGGQSASYVEGMSGNCSTRGTSNYQAYHNIELAYADDTSDCKTYDVPFSGASLPSNAFSGKFTLVLPNCPDQGSDDCGDSISNADTFLKSFVPAAMNTAAYKAGNTAILITWDEDEGSEGDHVPLIEIRPGANGFRDGTDYQSQASTLAAIENWAGVPLLGDASSATPLGSDFGL